MRCQLGWLGLSRLKTWLQVFSFGDHNGKDSGRECAVKAVRSRLHTRVEMTPVSLECLGEERAANVRHHGRNHRLCVHTSLHVEQYLVSIATRTMGYAMSARRVRPLPTQDMAKQKLCGEATLGGRRITSPQHFHS